jgi:hypothetical protein
MRAQALIADDLLTASNATSIVQAIEDIFSEDKGVEKNTKSNRWSRFLKSATPDQRALLAPARATSRSNVNRANGSRSNQHQIDAQALITDLTASNATAKERAIKEIFSEGEGVKQSAKSKRWRAFLKSVTADQRALLDRARAKSKSDVRSHDDLMNAVQRRDDAQSELAAERKGSKNNALPTPTTGKPDFDLLELAPHKEIILARLEE